MKCIYNIRIYNSAIFFENIEAKNIPEILKELEQTKEEDINNIKLAEAQSTIIKCLGLAS